MQTAALKLEKSRIADYWDLTKPGITFLVAITALAGFYLATSGKPSLLLLIHSLLGIILVSSGGGTLNHFIERKYDAMMHRTRTRPIPSGRVQPAEALVLGIVLSAMGVLYLAFIVNILTSVLALMTLMSYIAVYTPLKRITPHSTIIGAFPGAMPPVLGWTAATGTLQIEALILFAIVFFWQMPHFLGIAWMYRKDYERGGFPMLPVVEPDGFSTTRMILVYSIGLIPISLLPTIFDLTSTIYFIGALLCGLFFLFSSLRLVFDRSNSRAKFVVLMSVVYLPVVMILLILDVTK